MKKLTNNYSQLPLDALEPQFQAWSQVLEHHQSGNIFFLKNTGMLTRLVQFLDWYKSKNSAHLDMLDFDIELITSPREFALSLANLKSNTILIARDHFTRPDSQSLEITLQKHYLTSTYNLLIVHECAPHELYMNQSFHSPLFENQFLYSAPSEAIILQSYISNISNLWNMEVSQKVRDEALEYCGNSPWLINEYLRLQASFPKYESSQIQELPALKYRVKALFDGLPHHYHEAFLGQPVEHFINLEIKTFNLTGNWLNKMINYYKQSLLQINGTQVIYNSIDHSSLFSAGEKRLLNFFKSDISLQSREIVATALYEKETIDYSDWALSQAISRLRNKLHKLGIPMTIKPKRGKGYEFIRET